VEDWIMRCNIKVKELPDKCPKCGKKLKSEKCSCGHKVCQEETNQEKAWLRADYVNFGFGW
jgi:predicted amidophosphoribosyltransferase